MQLLPELSIIIVIIFNTKLNGTLNADPVKNVIWALMEIPSHFTSSQIDGISLVQIHTKFHHHTMSFIHAIFVLLAGTWHGFWTRSSHGISTAFAKKMMGFPVRLWSHFRTKPNCRQYGMGKPLSHFLQGLWKFKNEK